VRKAISDAESMKMDEKSLAALRSLAEGLEKSADATKNSADSMRLRALAEILKQPEKR
jgi:hypothetical protein